MSGVSGLCTSGQSPWRLKSPFSGFFGSPTKSLYHVNLWSPSCMYETFWQSKFSRTCWIIDTTYHHHHNHKFCKAVEFDCKSIFQVAFFGHHLQTQWDAIELCVVLLSRNFSENCENWIVMWRFRLHEIDSWQKTPNVVIGKVALSEIAENFQCAQRCTTLWIIMAICMVWNKRANQQRRRDSV